MPKSNAEIRYFDFESPDIIEYSITPTREIDLDPYSPIRVWANITDNFEISNVYIRYRFENDSVWTDIPIYLIDGLYQGNFTTAYENNALIKVYAEDTSGNYAEGFDDLYQIAYDVGWHIFPDEFNDTGIKIDHNGSIGNMMIISESDYNFTVNLSYVSDRNIYFNNSRSMLVYVPANNNVSIDVKGEAFSSPSEDNVDILVTDRTELSSLRNILQACCSSHS